MDHWRPKAEEGEVGRMRILRVEVQINENAPTFSYPRNAKEILEAMSKWCLTKDFRWKFDEGEWEKETVPFDYTPAKRKPMILRWLQEWWECL
jgi:hypothetical protein